VPSRRLAPQTQKPDGSLGQTVVAGYDFKAHKKI
jgi:hypothetical protein